MDETERVLIEALDRAVRDPKAAEALRRIAESVEAALEAAPSEPLSWAAVPLETYGRPLPAQIKSSWVFLLRAKVATGAEKHSNSTQRMTSFRGRGDFQTRPAGEWTPHPMRSDPEAPLEERWISIPEGVWHQGLVGPENWVVVSFHTVPEQELAEERPAEDEGGGERRRGYSAGR